MTPSSPATPQARSRLRRCAWLLSGALATASASQGVPPAAVALPNAEQRLQVTLQALAARDDHAMMVQLRSAAEAGDIRAQELLGIVLLVGPTVFGRHVAADRCAAAGWLRKSAMSGSNVARYHLDILNRSRTARPAIDSCN